jgi:DnaB-like helicase C terminal domain
LGCRRASRTWIYSPAACEDGTLIVVAGPTAAGISTFGLTLARMAAIRAAVPTLVVSLDLTGGQVIHRLLCAEGSIDSQRLLLGRLDERDWALAPGGAQPPGPTRPWRGGLAAAGLHNPGCGDHGPRRGRPRLAGVRAAVLEAGWGSGAGSTEGRRGRERPRSVER